MKRLNFKKFPVTIGVILACVLIYIYTSITYSLDMSALEGYEAGGFMPLAIYVNHEYTRFFTANFIHFGFSHLLMNMISLYNIGPFMESVYGKIRYSFLLIASCLGTTILPYVYYLLFEDAYGSMGLTVSGGASGIILGLIGGLCCLAVFYKSIFKQAFKSLLPSLMLVAFISVVVPRVSLSGHLGGFIGGFIMTFVLVKHQPLYLWKIKSKNKQDVTNRPC